MYVPADPSPGRARKLRTLETAESLAMLDTSLVHSPTPDPSNSRFSALSDVPVASLTLQISLRRARLALLVGLATVVVVALTVVLSRGTELTRFDRKDLTIDDQEKLLDRYNSYSGTIASAIGRPLELFVSLMAQVLVLWFMTESVMASATSWNVKLTVLMLGISVGFLLTNGLSALNVQVREEPVTVIMSSSDLSIQASDTTLSSTTTFSFSERTPQNPTTNTILRNLILPRAAIAATCSSGNKGSSMQDDSITFGMPQRAWMKDFLPAALPAATLRIDLLANKTNSTASAFPTSASIAADLLVSGVSTSGLYAAFDAVTPFNLNGDPQAWHSDPKIYIQTSRLAGLLPSDPASTEEQDRVWFLARSTAFVRAAASAQWNNASSLRRWTMDVTRVNITPSVWIDAVTIESELNANELAYEEGWNASSTGHVTVKPDTRNPDAQIHAFAVCLNRNGTETLYSTLAKGEPAFTSQVVCQGNSKRSMYVFSSGRHYVGDARTKKIRAVYSTTFARISWELQNLSAIYGATCKDAGDCMGLDATLHGTNQSLLVGASALPTDQPLTVQYTTLANDGTATFDSQQPLEIVSVRRPTENQGMTTGIYTSSGDSIPKLKDFELTIDLTREGKYWVGDVLMRHNETHNSTSRDSSTCDAALDRRVQNYINNHLYMETTLQPTYTAAAFFLFQNGMAKDMLPQATTASGSMPLQLDRNVQAISVRLSIPQLNAVLTLVGCVVLITALVLALLRSHLSSAAEHPHHNVTMPHQIARVMLDDSTFPSLLLKRRVAHHGREGDADEFLIETLSVREVTTKANDDDDTTSV